MMNQPRKIAIIGGGAVGLCTAYYLQEQGHQVTLIEKNAFHDGASHGNAGMLVPSHVIPLAAPGVISQGMRMLLRRDSPFRIKPRLSPALLAWLWQFRKYCTQQHVDNSMALLRDLSLSSMELFANLSGHLDFDFEQSGLLMLHNSQAGEKDNFKYAKMARKVGLDVQEMNAQDLHALEPGIKTLTTGAVYYPQDGHLNPNRLVSQLKAHLESKGVTFKSETSVEGFTQKGSQITALKTSTGDVEADEFVLAAGSWSPLLARQLGVNIPLQPAKGYSITLDAPEDGPKIPMILSEAKVTVTPFGNKLRFAGTLEIAGYDFSVDRIRASSILNTLSQYYPNLKPNDIKTEDIWSGFRPCTPDGLPVIGRSASLNNMIFATGHAMIGITLAPITGKLVSQVISGQTPSVPLEAMHPDRF